MLTPACTQCAFTFKTSTHATWHTLLIFPDTSVMPISWHSSCHWLHSTDTTNYLVPRTSIQRAFCIAGPSVWISLHSVSLDLQFGILLSPPPKFLRSTNSTVILNVVLSHTFLNTAPVGLDFLSYSVDFCTATPARLVVRLMIDWLTKPCTTS